MVTVVVAAAAACVPPSTLPDGTVAQAPPIAANGVAWDGEHLWLCDLFGRQLLEIDPATGRILRRFGPDTGIAPPDDVVITPDGSIVYTSPQTGVVGRIPATGPSAGRPQVLAQLEPGVNPIALTPDGTAVVVGFGSGDADRIDRIDLGTGAVTTVATGVSDINGFSFGPDGALWAPVGGVPSAFTGDGAILRIDIATGATRRLSLSFPDEPAKRGLQFGVSAKFTPDGRLIGLQGVGAALYEIDPATGVSRRFSTIGSDWADNQVATPDGRVFVTGFFGTVFEVDAAGVSRPLRIGA